jgi:hypothetical protein
MVSSRPPAPAPATTLPRRWARSQLPLGLGWIGTGSVSEAHQPFSRAHRIYYVHRMWRADRAASGDVVMLAVGVARRRILLGRPSSQWLR